MSNAWIFMKHLVCLDKKIAKKMRRKRRSRESKAKLCAKPGGKGRGWQQLTSVP
jgi:hypothetical protein